MASSKDGMQLLYDTWLYRLILNFYGYTFVVVPLFLFIRFYKSKYPQGYPGSTVYAWVVRMCVFGQEEDLPKHTDSEVSQSQSHVAQRTSDLSYFDQALRLIPPQYRESAKLAFCFIGLQLCYVTWGYFQERVMTIRYNFETPKLGHGFQPQRDSDAHSGWKLTNQSRLLPPNDHDARLQANKVEGEAGEYFRDSQFLVFVNRVFAMFLSGAILLVRERAIALNSERSRFRNAPRAAAYKYSFASLSNTLSSWFQYEALKYVSFPTQVICKSAKMVATMFMTKLVSSVTRTRRVTYSTREWVTACAISMGVCLFLLGSEYEEFKTRVRHGNNAVNSAEDARPDGGDDLGLFTELQASVSGVVILAGYLVADSFTTTYQASLFNKYHMSSVAMMFATNAFSFACCGVSLLCQGAFSFVFRFIAAHPDFLVHIAVVSFTSALGQLFIFYTIDQFGAVTFALIMTARQALSIVISCAAFAHPVTALGWAGLVVAVAATVVRSRLSSPRARSRTTDAATLPTKQSTSQV